jgi:hypothetical protein
VGRKTHHRFSLGDAIRIKVVKANLIQKQLDFEFVRKLTADGFENNSSVKNFFDIFSKKTKAAKGKKSSKKKRK